MQKIDLHSHTLVSDGSLSPLQLLQRAQANAVDILAITDHDSIEAYQQLGNQALNGLRLIAGIELSTQWRGVGVHIVGLNIDLTSTSILSGVAQQEQARSERAQLIYQRLTKLGLAIDFERVKEIANQSNIGRPHFAQHLVEVGAVKNMATAFKKYLGDGKPGEWIVGAGGVAVLAHPLKYKLTRTKLSVLLDDFIAAGGSGMEVVSGQQNKDETNKLARLCNEKNLLASCGSDFHQPSQWSEIGTMAAFPSACEPVWAAW